MNNTTIKSYHQAVLVDTSKADAFYAVTMRLEKWWGKTDQPVFKVGDTFTTTFGKSVWKFEVRSYVPFDKICWECVEAHHVHDGLTAIETEWLGTRLFWFFNEYYGKTEIEFVHEGLHPDLNCFSICRQAWDHFIVDSLKNYLEVGVGYPYIS
ncbi:hypothetical protein QQ020_21540 [Fulvivirgaceae bacterium BMA12]|uniref:Activator of Hsp90 ATPase homolog 1-like protein n=1 Tax=Agaribacillus aureus TaxID=3051825 RepID=A0ABT8LA99_9BACT|nr:hypothetical protein [Fulvivirgaceae bacterium BMA12]